MSGVFDLKFNEKVMTAVAEKKRKEAEFASVDFEDEAAIVAMIDHAMAIEEAEEELFDHAANFEV